MSFFLILLDETCWKTYVRKTSL